MYKRAQISGKAYICSGFIKYFLSILILISFNSCKDSPVGDDFPGGSLSYAICYHKDTPGQGWEIFLNSLEANRPKNISNSRHEDSDAAWSPDGNYIAYTHFFCGTLTDICLYDLRTGRTINLTDDGDDYDAVLPRWSADGKKIIFQYHKVGQKNCTYIMNSDGSGKRKLLDCNIRNIHYFTDKRTFLYWPVDDDIKKSYYLYKTDTSGTIDEILINLKTLAANYATFSDFNPHKNELLLLVSNDEKKPNSIATYNLDTKLLDTILLAGINHDFIHPKYSHDYKKISFVECPKGISNGKFCVYFLNTRVRKTLLEINSTDKTYDFNPTAFSLNDEYIAYAINIIQPGHYYSWRSYLYAAEISTGKIYFIDEADSPVWNPVIK